jgi:hypothetical protein
MKTFNRRRQEESNDMGHTRVPVLRVAVLVTVIGLSSVVQVYAQTEKGAFEVGIEAGPLLFIATGGHETVGGFMLSVEPHVGYFVSDELVVGVTGFFYRSIDSDPSQPAISFGGAYTHVNYHFNSRSTFSPYIGGRIGVFKPNSEAQFAAWAQGGLQYFVTRQLSVNGQLEIGMSSGSGGDAFFSCVGLGLSYYIK